jgi:hypothetical protein
MALDIRVNYCKPLGRALMTKQDHWFDLPVNEMIDSQFTPGLRKGLADLHIQRHSAGMGVPRFLSLLIQWYERNCELGSKCGVSSSEDPFDELGELINDAIKNWDKDPIIRKLLWTR